MAPAARLLPLALLLCLCGLQTAAVAPTVDERFIGWQGESYKPGAGPAATHASGAGAGGRRRWIETISWRPRAYIYHGFLSDEEADHIVRLVEDKVMRSSVVDVKTGVSMLDPIRTSWGGSIDRGQDAVVSMIEQRIAEWTHLPPDYGEPIQVLRYQDKQEYAAHWDWFDDPVHTKPNDTENRAATVLMYLGQVEEGGETALPIAVPIDAARQSQGRHKLSFCGRNGTLSVMPHKGDALLFFDLLPDGRNVCRKSLHASCPTLKGTKWTATKWIHNKPLGDNYDALGLAARCRDLSPECSALADAGACDSRAREMTGLMGQCRKSCLDCIDCAAGDVVCLRRNLRSLRMRPAGAGVGPGARGGAARAAAAAAAAGVQSGGALA